MRSRRPWPYAHHATANHQQTDGFEIAVGRGIVATRAKSRQLLRSSVRRQCFEQLVEAHPLARVGVQQAFVRGEALELGRMRASCERPVVVLAALDFDEQRAQMHALEWPATSAGPSRRQ
jgi:hypothetical protein